VDLQGGRGVFSTKGGGNPERFEESRAGSRSNTTVYHEDSDEWHGLLVEKGCKRHIISPVKSERPTMTVRVAIEQDLSDERL